MLGLSTTWVLWAYALLHLAGPGEPGQLVVGAAVGAATLLAVAVAARTAVGRLTELLVPAGRTLRGWRRTRRSRPARLFDPDAAGRPRPRAPSAVPPVA